jgi:hypothetical protein
VLGRQYIQALAGKKMAIYAQYIFRLILNDPFPNRHWHWQSPGRYYIKLPNSPATRSRPSWGEHTCGGMDCKPPPPKRVCGAQLLVGTPAILAHHTPCSCTTRRCIMLYSDAKAANRTSVRGFGWEM